MKTKVFSTILIMLSMFFLAGCINVYTPKNPTDTIGAVYYTITFDLQGGESTSITNAIVKKDARYPQVGEFQTSTITKENYVFDGFYSEPNGLGTKYNYIEKMQNDVTLFANWIVQIENEPNVVVLTLNIDNVNNEQIVVEKQSRYPQKGSLLIPAKEGYLFLGWFNNNSFTGEPIDYVENIEENTTLYANFIEINEDANAEVEETFIITFDPNGGFGIMSPQAFLVEETKPLAKNQFTAPENDYYFSGWSTVPNADVVYADESSISLEENTILYAIWTQAETYLVEFFANGGTGSMNSYLILKDETFVLPQNTFQAGYGRITFGGWSTEQDSDAEYKAGDNVVITGNTKFYATWKTIVLINYHPNGGQGTMGTQSTMAGNEATLFKNAFTKSGYVFAGWSTVQNTDNAIYMDEGSYSFNTTTTLYAVWKVKEYFIITYQANGGNGTMAPQTVEGGVLITLNANTFTAPYGGIAFGGWALTSSSEAVYVSGQTITVNANLTLYARWVGRTLADITFYPNGGLGSAYTKTILTSSIIQLPANEFLSPYSGVTFRGWALTSNGPVVYQNKEINKYTNVTNLYAVWGIVYKVNLKLENNNIVNYTYAGLKGTRVPASGVFPTPYKEGYVFNGWFTGPNGQGTKYTYIESLAGETNLYADWKSPYTTGQVLKVQFDLPTSTSTITGLYSERIPKVGNFEAPTGYEEYEFRGYYTKLYGAGERVDFIASLQKNTTLYAYMVYVGKPVTLTFEENGGTQVNDITARENNRVPESGLLKEPLKVGYQFMGWFTEPNGQGTKYIYVTELNNDLTLYAHYVNTSLYTVQFNTNGGENISNLYVAKNTRVPSVGTLIAPVKTGHTFMGWYTSENFTGQQYTSYTVQEENVTLYAKWSVNNYTITFNARGGTSVSNITNPYGVRVPSVGNFNEPVRAGYVFMGWYTNPDGTGLIKNYIKNLNSNITLYAKWNELDSDAKRAEANYKHNLEVEKTFDGFDSDGYIMYQSSTYDFKYGNYTSDNNGCGWIAVYNALRYLQIQGLYDEKIVISDIIRYLDHYGLIMDGKFGTWPDTIKGYLKTLGFEINMYSNDSKFDEVIANADLAITWRIITWNAHYQTITQNESGLTFYNDEDYFDNYSEYKNREGTGLYYLLTIDVK